MQLPVNKFKAAILAGRQQIGLWVSLPDPYCAEIVAGSGFDWLLIDTEHSPSDPINVLAQLQAVAPYPVSAIVRPTTNDTVLIKLYLDSGAQTLLIPYVQNATEARAAVSAMRYAPEGIRGMAGLTRATNFGRVTDYTGQVQQELCLLVQVETQEAINNIDEIASVDGVDGIFIGPADLAASMGHAGNAGHPAVVSTIENAIQRMRKAGKPVGILTTDNAFAERCIELGTTFTAVGLDIHLLARTSDELAKKFIKERQTAGAH